MHTPFFWIRPALYARLTWHLQIITLPTIRIYVYAVEVGIKVGMCSHSQAHHNRTLTLLRNSSELASPLPQTSDAQFQQLGFDL